MKAFLVGTGSQVLLPYPYEGKFYDYFDKSQPALDRLVCNMTKRDDLGSKYVLALLSI